MATGGGRYTEDLDDFCHRVIDAIEGLRSMQQGHGIRIDWSGDGRTPTISIVPSAVGGDAVLLAEVQSRTALGTYLVDLYSGWKDNFTLPVAKRIAEDAIMKTPTLNDAVAADQLVPGTVLHVRLETFTEPGPTESSYWVPIERVGLP